MPSPLVAVAVDAAVALAIITAASVLLALHDLTEATAIALFTTAVAVIGGSTKALLALKVPPPDGG